jgi:hypothetical protein
MSKKTAIAEAIISPADQPITDLVDLGYRQSGTRDTLQKQARFALGKIAGFPESIDDDSKALLYQGYKRRYNENYPPIMFGIVGGNYLVFDSLALDAQEKVKEKVSIGVDVVYSYTQQEFGKLSTTEPAKYAVIKSIREKCNTYMSGCLSDLKGAARKVIKADNPESSKRAPNKDFSRKVDDALEGLLDNVKVAIKRGDATADKERLIKAIAAFKAAWVK